MTKQEAAIIMAYTEISMLTGHDFSIFRKYIEEKLKRPVWTHELADKAVWEQIKESSREDFINLCKSLKNDTNELADKAAWEQIKESSFINLCKSIKNGTNAQWEYVCYDSDYLMWTGTCTACHQRHESNENVGKLPFCPHCGAKMNGVRVPDLMISGR